MRYELARGTVPPPWTVIAWSRVNYRGMQEWKEQHGYVEPEQADTSKDRASNPIGTSEGNPTFLQLNPASLSGRCHMNFWK